MSKRLETVCFKVDDFMDSEEVSLKAKNVIYDVLDASFNNKFRKNIHGKFKYCVKAPVVKIKDMDLSQDYKK